MTATGRVLLVEDDKFLRRACETSLRQRGFGVVTATDGEEGLRLAREIPYPDVILLDLLMPKMSGIEVLRALKGDAATKAIPVVILSNSSRDEDKREAVELGAVGYYVKANLSLKELAAQVSVLIEQHAPRVADLVRLAEFSDGTAEGLRTLVETLLTDIAETTRRARRCRGATERGRDHTARASRRRRQRLVRRDIARRTAARPRKHRPQRRSRRQRPPDGRRVRGTVASHTVSDRAPIEPVNNHEANPDRRRQPDAGEHACGALSRRQALRWRSPMTARPASPPRARRPRTSCCST